MDERDAGFTLVELMVVMTLLMVIGAMLVMTFVQGTGAVFASESRQRDSLQAKVALENTTKALRTAVDPDGDGPLVAFEVAQQNRVVFYAALDNRGSYPSVDQPPRKVEIWLQDGTLRLRTTMPAAGPTGTTWPGTGSTRIIGTNLRSGAGVVPLFTYLAAGDTYTDSTGRAITSLPTAGGAVTGTARESIEAVEVWVAAQSSSKRTNETTVVSRVTLLNKEI
ncbi:hypothetical protein GCM10027194_30660 [Thalassiella azotivora]